MWRSFLVLLIVLLLLSCAKEINHPKENRVSAILKKNTCMSCHASARKMIGPAYEAIAEKYKAHHKARQQLKEKIKYGGSGVWGVIAMPPNPFISDEEIEIVLDWILTQKAADSQ